MEPPEAQGDTLNPRRPFLDWNVLTSKLRGQESQELPVRSLGQRRGWRRREPRPLPGVEELRSPPPRFTSLPTGRTPLPTVLSVPPAHPPNINTFRSHPPKPRPEMFPAVLHPGDWNEAAVTVHEPPTRSSACQQLTNLLASPRLPSRAALIPAPG